MRVAIGSDHAGFALKGELCSLLDEMRVEYRDFGTFSDEPVDYPDFIAPVARAVARGDFDFGIVLGGSGTGEAIVANKVRGIRCVQATNPVVARLARAQRRQRHLVRGADRGDRGGAGLRARVPGRFVPGRSPCRGWRRSPASRPRRPVTAHGPGARRPRACDAGRRAWRGRRAGGPPGHPRGRRAGRRSIDPDHARPRRLLPLSRRGDDRLRAAPRRRRSAGVGADHPERRHAGPPASGAVARLSGRWPSADGC